jgi:hypothetical protein
MIFSRALLGTATKKTTMNWWDYWINHCWFTGWQSMRSSFRNWGDLMTDNYKGYAVMFYDDPYEECYSCFWSYLGEDDTLPKDFLEGLMEMAARIERGEEKLIPMEDVMEKLKSWREELDDVEDDEQS